MVTDVDGYQSFQRVFNSALELRQAAFDPYKLLSDWLQNHSLCEQSSFPAPLLSISKDDSYRKRNGCYD